MTGGFQIVTHLICFDFTLLGAMTGKADEDKPISRQLSEGSKTPRYREAEQLFNQRFVCDCLLGPASKPSCHNNIDNPCVHSAVGH